MTGIIMSGNHPKLILNRLKTITRRVIKTNLEAKLCKNSDIVRYCNTKYRDTYMFEIWHPANKNTPLPLMIRCSYGKVGDVVYVKEAYCVDKMFNHLKPSEIPNPDSVRRYFVDDPLLRYGYVGRWRSPLFMPRWASRITLEITEVRAERLQEITGEDCLREGLALNYQPVNALPQRFKILWDSLNGKKYPWSLNPWVWVIRFTLIAQEARDEGAL